MDIDLTDDIDVSCDQGEISGIRDDVAVLNRYYDEIAAQGGVSRDTAQTLVRDCAVQFPENVPIVSFTEVPSRTNLTITQEGIFSTIASHTVEIIKKAAALLAKITRWIMEQLRALLNTRHEIAKQLRGITGLQGVMNKHSDLQGLVVPEGADSHLKSEFLRAVQDVHKASSSYESNFNNLVVDMLTKQRFTVLLRNVGIDLLSQHSDIETKLSLYLDLLQGKLNGGNVVETAQLTQQLQQIIEPLRLPRVAAQLREADVVSASDSLADICDGLRGHVTQMRTSRPATIIPFDEAATLATANADELVAPYIIHADQWLRTIDKLDHQLHQLQNVPASAMVSPDVAKLYLAASDTISREISALRQYYVTTVACDTVRNQFCDDLWEMFVTQTKVMKVKAAILGNDASLRQDLNVVGSQLRAA